METHLCLDCRAKLLKSTLDSIDTKFNVSGSPLSAVAGDNNIFVSQKTEVSFDACSLEDVARLLIVVHDAIIGLRSCRARFDMVWLIAQGLDAGINLDEAILANYEHLLMRLQSQLMAALSRKALEVLLLGDYDKKQHRLLSWFTEFSDKRRPLSTSLDMKPSLAVLWGVCWMFYNSSQTNNGRVPREAVLQHVDLAGWRTPEPTECEYAPLDKCRHGNGGFGANSGGRHELWDGAHRVGAATCSASAPSARQ